MDEIRIDNLEVYAYHGVFPEENEKGQPFFVNLVLYADTRKAGQADELTLSTHYGEVCHFVTKWMQEHTCKLIETVAENIAKAVLLEFPLVEALDVEIRKPQAPIGLPFESVSVKIHRGWHKAYIAIGSNMGEKEKYSKDAIQGLADHEEILVSAESTLITTEPYGGVEQDVFLNGMVEIKTLLTPHELLDYLHELEQKAGRERILRWGPRTLDLDILFYENVLSDSKELMIPHPDMQNREFVLKPLAELCPYYVHPLLGKSVGQMLNELKTK